MRGTLIQIYGQLKAALTTHSYLHACQRGRDCQKKSESSTFEIRKGLALPPAFGGPSEAEQIRRRGTGKDVCVQPRKQAFGAEAAAWR